MAPSHLIKIVFFLIVLFQASTPELSGAKHQIKDKYIAFQDKHFKQIKSFNQVLFEYIFFNEKNAPVLKGASGLCGLLSLYGGLCLMEALELKNDSEKPSSYIKKITSTDHFYRWVNENKTILADVKNRRKLKTLGCLTPSAIREIAHHITSKENPRPTSFKKKACFYKQNRVTSFTFDDMVADKLLDNQYEMAKEFRASKNPKPLLILFCMERNFYLDWIQHCIAVVITKDTTWIVDPCNYDFTIDDYYIQQLDSFIRTGKTFPAESMPRYLLSSLPKWFIKKLKTFIPRSFLSKKESLKETEPIKEELEEKYEDTSEEEDDAMKELMTLGLEKYLDLYAPINSPDKSQSDESEKSESKDVTNSTHATKTTNIDS